MTEIITETLRCPICGEAFSLTENRKSLVCGGARHHCWDIASEGFVNFCGSHGGDSKEAVTARRKFLSLGCYAPLAERITGLLGTLAPGGAVCDAGCGEGYYSAAIASGGHRIFGFDLSRPAVAAAAKRKIPDSFFAVAGINEMPVCDSSFDGLVNIFAPCFEGEFSRVLKPGGIMILAGAGARHLYELKAAIYDEPTENTERADLPARLTLLGREELTYRFSLEGQENIRALFAMTPYYYRTSFSDAGRLASLDGLDVTADFEIYIYRKD